MFEKTGAIGSSHSTDNVWFNANKPEVKNEEEQKKNIDIGNYLNGTKACAYMG